MSIWGAIESNKVQPIKSCEKLFRATVKYIGEMTNVKSKNEFVKNNLMKIFDILILPNIAITQEDEDEYEDDPDAYIKNDLEESDVETRRRYCMKFVQQLSKKYPQEVGSLIGNYVNSFIAEYQANRESNWTRMTSLLNLLVTASISSYTYKSGATEINISPADLWNYVSQLALPELQEPQINNLPILKATCIKFVYMFRNQIDDQYAQTFVQLFIQFLDSDSIVNKSYAAACIEKFLLKRNAQNQPVITCDNIQDDVVSGLLTNLCKFLDEYRNLYAIRTLYRTIQIAKHKIVNFSEQLGQVLSKFIQDIANDQGDQSPNYVYILFETTALVLRNIAGNQEQMMKVQELLTPSLNFIVQNHNTELIGYAFQIYALFVASSQQAEVHDLFKILT